MTEERMLQPMREAQHVASVRQVFGEPTVAGDKTIIPVAAVTYAFGFGYGGGPERTDERGNPVRTGGGGGGGGQAKARPVAIIEVTAEETRVRPIEDPTRVALAGVALGAWTIFWLGATIRKFAKARK